MRVFVRLQSLCRRLVSGRQEPGGRAALVAALLALGVAAPVRADLVTATFSTVNPGEVVGISSTYGSNPEYGWAGVYNFVNASGSLNGSFGGFCIDISQNIYGNQTVTFGVTTLDQAPVPGNGMGPLRAKLIAELWANDHAQALTSDSNAAAFQIAIWEIINESNPNNLNVTTGNFQVTDSDTKTLTTANTWLAGLNLSGTGPQASNLIALTSAQYQDYVTMAPVPEPSGLVLSGIALGVSACGAAWRRRRQRTTPLAA
jgi:hypothetical protein